MRHNIHKLALEFFLRRGIHIKAENEPPKETRDQHSTPYYIWRTQRDNRVRSRHAEHEGKIYSWDNPPEGGHPGEDYNCRCWAEAYTPSITEGAIQKTTSIVDEGLYKWTWEDFVLHFYTGGGKPITLWEIGHLQDAINISEKKIYQKVEAQIATQVRGQGPGDVDYWFENSYSFRAISYPHGQSVVRGHFIGNAIQHEDKYIISGNMYYFFDDEFTDPLDIREYVTGKTSNPAAFDPATIRITDLLGTRFYVMDHWKTRIQLTVNVNETGSIYQEADD